MAEPDEKKKTKKPPPKKRELKSAPRKDGVQPLKKTKKSRKWIWISLSIVVVLILIGIFTPPYGTIRYGICREFVELHDPYPASIEFVQATEEDTLVTLDYNRIDTFGQRTLNQIKCYFGKDTNTYPLIKVDVNGKATKVPQEDPEVVKQFNQSIPAIISNPPSLVMPKGLSEDIKKYR